MVTVVVKGKGNGKQVTGLPFEALLKEDDLKGVVIKCRKPAIQSQNLHLVYKTHINIKNQPLVVDSIEFKEPIYAKQFVNANKDPVNYTMKKSDGVTDEVDAALKKNEENRVDHQVKFQAQEYQKTLMFIQTLWNIAFGQHSESFRLALIKKGTE